MISTAVLAIEMTLVGVGLFVFHESFHVEESRSMYPMLAPHDIVAFSPRSVNTVHVGEVIAFRDPLAPGIIVMHEVKAIVSIANTKVITTQGIANPSADPWTLRIGDQQLVDVMHWSANEALVIGLAVTPVVAGYLIGIGGVILNRHEERQLNEDKEVQDV